MRSGRGFGVLHERRRLSGLQPEGLSPVAVMEELLSNRLQTIRDERVNFLEWSLRTPTPKTGTLDFKRFPFQLAMYEGPQDMREEVIRKCTQVGISERMARWALYQTDTQGLTSLYVFPAMPDVYDFSDARISPMIEGSEYLRSRLRAGTVNNKTLKRIGLGFFYMRGSEKKRGLDSVDADALILDEYDTLQRENIPDAEKRISGSLKGMIRRVGVPSFPKTGIDALYNASDMRTWMVKCERAGCKEGWQELDFWKNVDQINYRLVCAGCFEPLDVAKGRWVAKHPERDVVGWHVSRLMVPGVDLKEIVANSKKREPYLQQVFYNKDLGLPFATSDTRLSAEVIAAAQREFAMVPGWLAIEHDGYVTMGVDVASSRALNVRISYHDSENSKRALWIGTVDTFDDLVPLFDRYDVNMAAIDHEPERRMAMKVCEMFPGRAYIVNYAPNQKDILAIDHEQRRASVRRTEAIDATMEMVRAQRNLLPIQLPEGYVDQMTSTGRFSKKDEFGRETVGYESNGPDDYLHAEVYDVVATELFWIRLQVGDLTRDTFRPLEDMLEFQRSSVDDYESSDVGLGPSGEPSFGPDEGLDRY